MYRLIGELSQNRLATGLATVGGVIACAVYAWLILKFVWQSRTWIILFLSNNRKKSLLKRIRSYRYKKTGRVNGHPFFIAILPTMRSIIESFAIMVLNSLLAIVGALGYASQYHRVSVVTWVMVLYVVLHYINILTHLKKIGDDYHDFYFFKESRKMLLKRIESVKKERTRL